jgi:hypothetical protein
MPSFHDYIDDGYAECAVCRSDTLQLCSPCGDPVCHNCACPNGCEAVSAGVPGITGRWDGSHREFPLDVARQAA